LSRCSISARGVWFEFLMVMHMADRCGLISGTREELARDARCTVVEVSTAIDEFNRTKTADVTERNSVVTVINRRMRREWEARQKGLERVKRHRATHVVTGDETQKPILVIECSSGSSGVKGESEGKAVDGLDMIYAAYPRKVAKPEALRAIGKAAKKVGFADLLAKTRAFAAAVEFVEPQFIPHPATWFNQERYNDDPATWNPKKKNGATQIDHSKGF
jgi:hypothetical protein